jgi:hypothetical protein
MSGGPTGGPGGPNGPPVYTLKYALLVRSQQVNTKPAACEIKYELCTKLIKRHLRNASPVF